MSVPADYFEEAMARLRDDPLNVSLDAVLQPISNEVQQKVKEQQSAASKATKVQQKDLTAQEWFEKGYNAKDPDEMIHYYTEAIRLNPGYVEAFNNRGIARSSKGDLDGASKDCIEALRIKSDYVNSLRLMGNFYAVKGEDIAAYFCLQKVVEFASVCSTP